VARGEFSYCDRGLGCWPWTATWPTFSCLCSLPGIARSYSHAPL